MSQANTSFNPSAQRFQSLRRTVLAVNILYAASLFVGVTSIIGVIVAHLKRGDAVGTVWEGHLTYAIGTFWIGLGLTLLGFVLWFVGLGWLIWTLTAVWWLVRIVRAFILWSSAAPVSNPTGFI